MQTLLYISILNTYIDLYSDKKITRLSFLIIFVLYIIKSHIKIILFYFMPWHDNSTKKILRIESWYSYHYKKKKKNFFHDFVSAISMKRSANRFVPCGASSFTEQVSSESWPLRNFLHTPWMQFRKTVMMFDRVKGILVVDCLSLKSLATLSWLLLAIPVEYLTKRFRTSYVYRETILSLGKSERASCHAKVACIGRRTGYFDVSSQLNTV